VRWLWLVGYDGDDDDEDGDDDDDDDVAHHCIATV
jgi:hypothetical protein